MCHTNKGRGYCSTSTRTQTLPDNPRLSSPFFFIPQVVFLFISPSLVKLVSLRKFSILLTQFPKGLFAAVLCIFLPVLFPVKPVQGVVPAP